MSAFHDRQVGSMQGRGLSRALGWLSVGLGASELLAPRRVARLIGVEADGIGATLLRLFGLRELAVGAAVLLRPQRSSPLWARVVGDAMDLSALGVATARNIRSRPRAAGALAALFGVTALDVLAARRVGRGRASAPLTHAITINRPPSEVFEFFRRLENLPLFMSYLDSVTVVDETHSRWVARLPVGPTVSWDAAVVDEVPGRRLSWRAEGAGFEHKGTVRFDRAPGRDATEVRVSLALGIAGAKPSPTLAKLLTGAQVKGDLRRLKQVLETGEIVFSDASAHVGRHPAQPSPEGARRAVERASRSREASERGELR